jgi:hypothetical protein
MHLPTNTTDLPGFHLYAHCGKCERSVRIYPGPLPRMPLVDLLRRSRCKERNCRGRAGYLELAPPDHGIPGAKDQYSPTWRMDGSGVWLERETVNPFQT